MKPTLYRDVAFVEEEKRRMLPMGRRIQEGSKRQLLDLESYRDSKNDCPRTTKWVVTGSNRRPGD